MLRGNKKKWAGLSLAVTAAVFGALFVFVPSVFAAWDDIKFSKDLGSITYEGVTYARDTKEPYMMERPAKDNMTVGPDGTRTSKYIAVPTYREKSAKDGCKDFIFIYTSDPVGELTGDPSSWQYPNAYLKKFIKAVGGASGCMQQGGDIEIATSEDNYGNPGDDNGGDEPENASVCSMGGPGLSWIICPVIDTVAMINDGAFGILKRMLFINPVTVQVGGSLYNTWDKFRDLANIAFIVAFLIVVFSQATSFGLSSYGIKKMLPRIIAAAILVNLSFFICQIALDLSNILGVSLGGFIDSMRSKESLDVNAISWGSAAAVVGGTAAAIAGVAVVMGSLTAPAAFALLLPIAVTALFAIITAVAVLVARQALIVILIAISPLAFVAFILPNTQKYFQMWQNSITTLLLLFPLAAGLFAFCELAANIILTSDTSEDGVSLLTIMVALGVMFVPLFGIPLLLKFSGGLLGRLGIMVNNPNKGPFDALRKKAEGYRDYKKDQGRLRANNGEFANTRRGRLAKKTFGRYGRYQSERDARYAGTKREADQAVSGYIAEQAIADEKFANKLAGGEAYQGQRLADARRRVQAQGLRAERKESQERVAAIQELLVRDEQNVTGTDSQAVFNNTLKMYRQKYEAAAAEGDHETMSAILKSVSAKGEGGRSEVSSMIQDVAVSGQTTEAATAARKAIERTVYEDLPLNSRLDIVKGGMGIDGKWEPRLISKLASEHIATLDAAVLEPALSGTVGADDQVTVEEAQRIIDTPNLISKVNNHRLEQMLRTRAAGGTTPPNTTPTPSTSRPAPPPPQPPTEPPSAPDDWRGDGRGYL